MTENLNSHRHAMRILRDLERQIDGGSKAGASTPAPARNTPSRAPMNGGARQQRQPGVPEFFARGVQETGRYIGNAVGGALSDVHDWHMNRGREVMGLDDERKRIEAEYRPQIRDAQRGVARARAGALSMSGREHETVDRFARGNQYIGERMDAAMYDPQRSPFSGSAPPEELSDDDLLAELEALNGRGGPR